MARLPKGGSNEGFSWVNGKKSDAAFHAAMLDNAEADAASRRWSRRYARERGFSEADIEAMYGLDEPPPNDPSPDDAGGPPATLDDLLAATKRHDARFGDEGVSVIAYGCHDYARLIELLDEAVASGVPLTDQAAFAALGSHLPPDALL